MLENCHRTGRNNKPIENHDTAPWANTEKLKPDSKVSIPNEIEVDRAKNWVDTNEK